MPEHFVSTRWLAEHIDDPDLAILDASWYLPTAGRDAHAEYLASHIPHARFFDIDGVADRTTSLPHMLPEPADFARMVGAIGISDSDPIVVYDEPGLYSAPRAWWTFRVMGADNVRILEGGGAKWRAEGRPTEAGEPAPAPKSFRARFRPELVRSFDEMKAALGRPGTTIADARSAERFAGSAPEPRPGLRSGHIPGSRNVPYTELTEDGHLRPATELRAIFHEAGIDLERPVVTSCGSGITAATLALALEVAGARQIAVYDGSWAEWGAREDAPVETGPA